MCVTSPEKEPILIACDASCAHKAGTGYIIWGNKELGVKHKIIVRKLAIGFSSTVMELITVQEALKLVPHKSTLTVINDCDLFRNINFHKNFDFKNKENKKSQSLEILERIYAFIKEKELSVRIVGKKTHEWHQQCHDGCRAFRSNLERGENMYEVYALDSEWTATLISRHFMKSQADQAVRERFFTRRNEEEQVRTVVALANNPQDKVKDLSGCIWKIKK